MDLARAYQEAKSLPDEVLQQELASPSGMLPGYIAMGELSERQAMRSTTSTSPSKRTSMAEELLTPRRGYAGGGLVAKANPFLAYLETRIGSPIVDVIQGEYGLTPQSAPEAPGTLLAPDALRVPTNPGQLPEPPHMNQGGLASLFRR